MDGDEDMRPRALVGPFAEKKTVCLESHIVPLNVERAPPFCRQTIAMSAQHTKTSIHFLLPILRGLTPTPTDLLPTRAVNFATQPQHAALEISRLPPHPDPFRRSLVGIPTQSALLHLPSVPPREWTTGTRISGNRDPQIANIPSIDIEGGFFLLTNGLSADAQKRSLLQSLDIFAGSEKDTTGYLEPNKWLSASTVDSCIQLFAKPFAQVVAVLPTWYQLIHDQGGYSGRLLNDLNMAMLKDGGKTLKTIIWPFLIENRFVLCVIRPDYTATVLNSLGATHGYLKVVKKVLATTAWKEWDVVAGTSAKQGSSNDCGVYCIANAAYTIAEFKLPSNITVDFWRLTCWSAMGLRNDDKHLAKSAFFARLRGRTQGTVSQAIEQIKDAEGLPVLKVLADGHPVGWWIYWRDKVAELVQAFSVFQKARSALPQVEVDAMEAGLIKMMDDADRHERHSDKTRRELAIQMGAHGSLQQDPAAPTASVNLSLRCPLS